MDTTLGPLSEEQEIDGLCQSLREMTAEFREMAAGYLAWLKQKQRPQGAELTLAIRHFQEGVFWFEEAAREMCS